MSIQFKCPSVKCSSAKCTLAKCQSCVWKAKIPEDGNLLIVYNLLLTSSRHWYVRIRNAEVETSQRRNFLTNRYRIILLIKRIVFPDKLSPKPTLHPTNRMSVTGVISLACGFSVSSLFAPDSEPLKLKQVQSFKIKLTKFREAIYAFWINLWRLLDFML